MQKPSVLAEALSAFEICFAENLKFKFYANMTACVVMSSNVVLCHKPHIAQLII